MTNREWINSLSDEELAIYLIGLISVCKKEHCETDYMAILRLLKAERSESE